MSKEAKKTKRVSTFKTKECQQGSPIRRLAFEDLNPHERAVVQTLSERTHTGRRKPKRIVDIMRENHWERIGLQKGNSRVRNALRRLVRSRLVEHKKEVGDGTYRITPKGLRQLES